MRLGFLVEGQTEETFVNNVLVPHLYERGVQARTAQKITTSRRRGTLYKGGAVPYDRFIRELARLLKQDSGVVFTTMIDYYALPGDYFPGDQRTEPSGVEAKIRHDIEAHIGSYPERIIPYVQLHEFETLLLAAPEELALYFDDQPATDALSREISPFDTPEKVNDTPEGAPSKRIMRHFPPYGRSKATAGPIIADRIGLARLRTACPRFGDWVDRLEMVQ